MDNRIKKAIDSLPIKSDLEDRIIARCKAETQESSMTHLNKNTTSRIRRSRLIAMVAYSIILLCAIIALPNRINNSMDGKIPSTSNVITRETTNSVTSTLSESQPNTVEPSETQSKATFSTTSTKKETPSTQKSPTVQSSILALGDFIPMTFDELTGYYGRKIIPTFLPEDLILQKNDYLGICKRNDTTPDYNDLQKTFYKGLLKEGDIIFDDNAIEFRSTDNDRELTIRVAKDRFPFNSIGDPTRFSKINIHGIEVHIHHYSDALYSNSDMYTALAMVDDVGYHLFANNFTKDEFMKVLTTILT